MRATWKRLLIGLIALSFVIGQAAVVVPKIAYAAAPALVGTDPADGAVQVGNQPITITFDGPIESGAPEAWAAIAVTDGVDNYVPSPAISGNALVLSPTLSPNLTYTVVIPPFTVKSAGTMDFYQNQISFSFNTTDTFAPVMASSDPTAGTTGVAVNKTITVTFNEPIQPGVAYGGINLVPAAPPNMPVAVTVGISGTALTVTPQADLPVGTWYTLTIPMGAVSDPYGNALAAQATIQFETAAAVDATAPSLSSAAVNGTILTLNYDEALDEMSAPAAGDFLVTVDSQARAVSWASVSGAAVELGLDVPVDAGQVVVLSYTPGASPIQDLAGNAAAALVDEAVANNTGPDLTPPGLVSASIDGATLALSYDESLAMVDVPATTDFAVAVNGSPSTVTDVVVAGSAVALTLASPALEGDTVTVGYTPGANPIQDGWGNQADALAGQAVTNNTAPAEVAPVVTLVSIGLDLIISTAERDGADPAGRTIVAQSDKDGFLYLVGTTVDLSGKDPAKVAAMEAAVAAGAAVKAAATAGADVSLVVGPDLPPGTYRVYAVDGGGLVSAGSVDITVEARIQALTFAFTDGDADHVYFHGNAFAVTVSGLNLADGTQVRVALPVLPGGVGAPLAGMLNADAYAYVEATVNGGSLSVSGTINNPGNATLPPGVIGLQVYSADGLTALTPQPVAVQNAQGRSALIGLIVPAGDVTVSPGFETLTNLYSTETSLTFARPGLGSITFAPGLDLITFRDQLMSLQNGVNLSAKGATLSAEVSTDILTFLAGRGATIVFEGAMAQLGLDGVTAANFRDLIVVGAADNAGNPVASGDLAGYLDLAAMSYDQAGDALTIPVNHFTAYEVDRDAAAPTWTGGQLTASGITQTGLTLTWSGASDNTRVTGYRVYRNGSLVATLGAVTTTNLTNLTAGTAYTFKVEAGDAAGNWSATGPSAQATTLSEQGGGGDNGGSGGGGGDGSDQSQTPAPEPEPEPEPEPAPVVKGDQADVTGSATIEVKTEDDGSTAASAALTTAAVEKALEADEAVRQVVLEIKEEADEQTAAVPAEAFVKMAQKEASIMVKTDKAVIDLPASVIHVEELAQTLGVDVKDVTIDIRISDVPSQEAGDLTGGASTEGAGLTPVTTVRRFELQARAGDKTVTITSFGDQTVRGEFALTDDDLAKATDPESLNVYKYDEATDRWVYVPSKADPDGLKVVFYTHTFSNYTVMEHRLTFADVQGYWAQAEIELMAAKHVVNGVEAGRFAPAKSLTRAEFAAMLVRAMGLAEDNGAAALFKDVRKGDWHFGAVQSAAKAGLIKGRSDGNFGPDDLVTREQMAIMLVRALRASGKGGNLSADQASAILSSFADRGQVSDWAQTDLAAAISENLLCGQDGPALSALAPGAVATRSEAAVMMARFWRK